MGVLDTTYTFTATDIVTSVKLNNVIDQTTFTSSAFSGTTLAINGSGQLRVNASGITSLELADNSVITAKITDANITQAKIATNVVGKGPAFRAKATIDTSIGAVTHTPVNLTMVFDTNSNFASNKFTATVAGYYLMSGSIFTASGPNGLLASIAKNNIQHSFGSQTNTSASRAIVSDIIYLNAGDFVELHAYAHAATTIQTSIADT